MALSPGTRLGPYEILAPLGAGGMGEVYRARDTRLDRDVAVKVLPSDLAIDPQARDRFEREAKAVAALSHPNILAIHDFGAEGATAYAVTELLAGETLRERLVAGPRVPSGSMPPAALPARKAIEIAIQIARGLAAAHDRQLIHRDLKPENIFISTDGHVKILDFGLARVMASASGYDTADAPTQLRDTAPGMVMGTIGYMAPEQVRGEPADHRADIFAFGCVLYEMVAGRRAFQRETAAETMTAILREDAPDLGGRADDRPFGLDPIIRRCLEKQPEERFQSARDLAFALQTLGHPFSSSAAVTSAPGSGRWALRRGLLWSAATVLIAGATGAAVWIATRPAPSREAAVIRAVLPLPGVALPSLVGRDDTTIALSPNGRLFAYVTPGHSSLMLRDLETGGSRVLAEGGTVGAPIFSPDSRFVAFVQGSGGTRTAVWGALKKIAVAGGAATTVADGIIGLKGSAWGDDDYIYYSPAPAMGLWRAPASGGTPEKLTDPDAAQGEKTHRMPFVLPGSRAVLFVVGTSRLTSFHDARIEALSLADRSRHRLVDGGSAPMYLPTGHLVYASAGQLVAVPFDPKRLALTGAPVTVADGVEDLAHTGASGHAVSADGTLFFISRATTPPTGAIVAIDRQGRATRLADAPYAISSGRVSPDGRRLAIDPDGATQQIAIIDFARNTMQGFTYEWDNASPIWSADGSRIFFRSNRGGRNRRLFAQAADGTGEPEALTTGNRDEIPTAISGRVLAYDVLDATTKNDLWVLTTDDRKSHVLVNTPYDEMGGRFSPDGRMIAYQSNQSGAWEIYVEAYPASGGRLQVSKGGGVRAEWQPDSRSLVYLKGTDVMSVAIPSSAAGEPGVPTRLFSLEADDLFFDVLRDGRLVVLRRRAPAAITSLGLIVNWFEHVRRLTGKDVP